MKANWILTNVVVDTIRFTQEGEYTGPWYMTWVQQGDPIVKHITSGVVLDAGFQEHCNNIILIAQQAVKNKYPNRHVDGKNALTRLTVDDLRTTLLRSINEAGLDEFTWVESEELTQDVEETDIFNRLRQHLQAQRQQTLELVTETV